MLCSASPLPSDSPEGLTVHYEKSSRSVQQPYTAAEQQSPVVQQAQTAAGSPPPGGQEH